MRQSSSSGGECGSSTSTDVSNQGSHYVLLHNSRKLLENGKALINASQDGNPIPINRSTST